MAAQNPTGPAARNGDGRDRAAEQASRIGQTGEEVLNEAGRRIRPKLEEGKQSAASAADDVTEALDDVGTRLAEQGHDTLAQAAYAAAERLSQLARYIETHSLDELTQEARRMARSKPAMMIAGGVALGFVLSRFLKASEPDDGDPQG